MSVAISGTHGDGALMPSSQMATIGDWERNQCDIMPGLE